MLFNKKNDIGEIEDFESLNLRFSGMRITEEYEIISNGEKSEISYYHIKYSGEEKRQLQKEATCNTQEVINTLNDCKAGKWNGFQGKHPRGVCDGRMFDLTISVNGGKKIRANGSENFPNNFRTLENWLTKSFFN